MALQVKSVLYCNRGHVCLGRHQAGGFFRAVQVPRVALSRLVSNAVKENDDEDARLTGEWPPNWSIASYDDVHEYFRNNVWKDEGLATAIIGDVMAKDLTLTTPDTPLKDVEPFFGKVSPHSSECVRASVTQHRITGIPM